MALPNGQVYSRAFIMRQAFPSAQRKRKSRFLSPSPPSPHAATPSSPPPTTTASAATAGSLSTPTAVLGEAGGDRGGGGGNVGGSRRDTIDLLLNFRRVRLERYRDVHSDNGMNGASIGADDDMRVTGPGGSIRPTRRGVEVDAMEEEGLPQRTSRVHDEGRRLDVVHEEPSRLEGNGEASDGNTTVHLSHSLSPPPKLLFTCPVTRQTFDVDQILPVYIV